jgi:hypothetical protein
MALEEGAHSLGVEPVRVQRVPALTGCRSGR